MPGRFTLVGADGKPHASAEPGRLGGHRRLRIYGELDCASAVRHVAAGRYVRHRVFFASVTVAILAGYRPCAICRAWDWAAWKRDRVLWLYAWLYGAFE